MRISDWSSDVCSSDLNAIAADIVINGLAILCRDCSGRPVYYDLEEAYRRDIIGGPAAFVITADDMASFATAVRKKLLLEIADVPDEATFRQRLAVREIGRAHVRTQVTTAHPVCRLLLYPKNM